jgi:hypothetical protein
MHTTSPAARPRLLIASRNLALLRAHYEDVIVALARAGVRISIRYRNEEGLSVDNYLETLVGRDCSVDLGALPRLKRDPGDRLALRLRQVMNLLRFYHPDYTERNSLREAKFAKAAPGPRRWAQRLGGLGSRASLGAIRTASGVDGLLPPSASGRALVESERPDAVAVVDVDRVPELVELLKAAAWKCVPTAIWIQSWDNLTTRGLLHFTPDRVFVWNAVQRDELARYHGIAERHVCLTGAQSFDHWFDGDSPSGRAEFCARNGIDPDQPIVLYLASARQAEMGPGDFFLPWLQAIRSSGDEVLERATVLLRPHPSNVQPWHSLHVNDPSLMVSPVTAEAPVQSPEFRRRYRDELQHASVAAALSTSGMIDAAIFGKPVCTVELPELAKGQRGYVHFEYLKTFAGGLLQSASSLDEHVGMLAALVRRDPYERDERSGQFVQAFVRPHGLEVTPAAVFTKEMLRLLEAPSEARLPSRLGRAVGRLIHRAAPVLGAPFEEEPLRRRLRKARNSVGPLRWLYGRWQSLNGNVRRMRARSRTLLKPIRRFLLVQLRAAVSARLRRLLHRGMPA